MLNVNIVFDSGRVLDVLIDADQKQVMERMFLEAKCIKVTTRTYIGLFELHKATNISFENIDPLHYTDFEVAKVEEVTEQI